ncbi:MAG TPA: hypothetical protein VMT15_03605 [Bryobacteraceae bacterium]|nr:hypothetical protein [Bryobacteraceae bacterium]
MKDLFVFTADADAEGLIRSVLQRPVHLGIRPITFDVERYTGRDSGMVTNGPEIARMKVQKTDYSRLILIWDHHGSGWHAHRPEVAVERIQLRLNGVTWEKRSAAVVLVPELEEWLWCCRTSLARHFSLTAIEFERAIAEVAGRRGVSVDKFSSKMPKEFFGELFYGQRRAQPLPEDFARLGAMANLDSWSASSTFHRFRSILQGWFPT